MRRCREVLRPALALISQFAESIFGVGIARGSRLGIPFRRLGIILGHTTAAQIGGSEADLCMGKALLRCLAVPRRRGSVVLLYPLALGVEAAESVLPIGIPLSCRFAVPGKSACVVLLNRFPTIVQEAQAMLGGGVTLCGQGLPVLQRCCKVAPGNGTPAGVFRCGGERHGDGQSQRDQQALCNRFASKMNPRCHFLDPRAHPRYDRTSEIQAQHMGRSSFVKADQWRQAAERMGRRTAVA